MFMPEHNSSDNLIWNSCNYLYAQNCYIESKNRVLVSRISFTPPPSPSTPLLYVATYIYFVKYVYTNALKKN